MLAFDEREVLLGKRITRRVRVQALLAVLLQQLRLEDYVLGDVRVARSRPQRRRGELRVVRRVGERLRLEADAAGAPSTSRCRGSWRR